jgi:hypothetical protein
VLQGGENGRRGKVDGKRDGLYMGLAGGVRDEKGCGVGGR